MTTVILGSNRIEDCDHVVSLGADPVLSVGTREGRPLVSSSLVASERWAAVQVRENTVVEGPLAVEEEEGAVRVLKDGATVVHARVTR